MIIHGITEGNVFFFFSVMAVTFPLLCAVTLATAAFNHNKACERLNSLRTESLGVPP